MTLHVLHGWGGGYARCRMKDWLSDDEGDHEMRDGGGIADGLSYLLKSGGCRYQVFCWLVDMRLVYGIDSWRVANKATMIFKTCALRSSSYV